MHAWHDECGAQRDRDVLRDEAAQGQHQSKAALQQLLGVRLRLRLRVGVGVG